MNRIGLFLAIIVASLSLAAGAWAADSSKSFAGSNASSASSEPAREWLGYYKGEGNPAYKNVAAFITRHPDFPGMPKLRERAEKSMPSNITDAEALAWFDKNPPETTFGMQTYAAAMRRAGRGDEATKKINEWWRAKTLTPADQSKAYMAFATHLDKAAHEERLRVLIYRGQYTNARAVAEALGGGYKALTEARISLRTGKGSPNAHIAKIPQALLNDEGLLFDRLQFRRKAGDNTGAIEILNRQPAHEKLYSPDDWGRERGIIARRFYEDKKYGMAYKIAADNRIKTGTGFSANEWLAGWLALEFLNKPWEAFEHFERLYHGVESPISRSRGAYWAGRASERLNHPAVAQKWYNVGAHHSATFYGQLSAEKLGEVRKISSGSATPSAMRNGALAQGAKWLQRNGHKTEALMFFNAMQSAANSPADYAAIAVVANEVSRGDAAIRAAQECERKHGTTLIGYSFPKIEKYMNDVAVEWALVHALVRQESRYDSAAISSAGARGLMQLMPGTAREVASKAGLRHEQAWLISRPAHNVELGTRYLNQLLTRYNGNYALALAAYNAGPARADRWIKELGDPRDPKVDLVNWIENIPFYETRNYVQRVLEAVYVYRQTLSTNRGRKEGATHIALQ